ncbi:2-oxoglutarate dehydrogenase complex dihydrolipoyllysine-residue succinyltransferase [Saccharicrinis sp. FJH54]|uniref:2-oxoglutarate dehydrogenase complex dihydrolipoyllysine-residue succinyltransferase n=1 Tax=Saccharicrinis sp. FJH54 TaxID=3344665 RepID=UPI0035D45BE2
MILEIKIPSPGESITEVELATWNVKDGDQVKKDQEVAEIESDKATLPLLAEQGGKITILIKEGEMAKPGDIACKIDTEAKGAVSEEAVEEPKKEQKEEPETKKVEKPAEKEEVKESKPEKKQTASEPAQEKSPETNDVKVTPVAQAMMEEAGVSVEDIINGLKRISSREVKMVLNEKKAPLPTGNVEYEGRKEERQRMSQLRKKLSKRLVAVKNETAMLTTFNEVDMHRIISLRQTYNEQFIEKYGIKLGFMSFFTKAVAKTLKHFPMVNARIEEDQIVLPDFADVAIAVSTPKGLMVPVVRDADKKSIPQIEQEIADLAKKAREAKLSIEEMTGGTFTITNGGVFGSLLSTPIINPPQSAILGMHNIVERPVAENGQVVIRPMMYVALSYDHRIIDGKDSVSFLVKLKQYIENPEGLFMEI